MKETNTSAVEQNNESKSADQQNIDNSAVQGNESPNSVPYARFNDINKKYNAVQDELKDFKQSREDERIKEMEEQGQFKERNAELTSENTKLKEKLAYHEGLEQQERESLLSNLSQDEQDIYGGLSTSKLRKHINSLKSTKSVRTDMSSPKRGNPLSDKKDSDLWDMEANDKKKNWLNIIDRFQNKQKN